MSNCHHIDWDGLQILVNTANGQENPTYKCLLCDTNFNPEEYRELIEEIREKKKDDTLKFWRTPSGKEHKLEDCPDEDKCFVHKGDN